jgi:hypothetical protein
MILVLLDRYFLLWKPFVDGVLEPIGWVVLRFAFSHKKQFRLNYQPIVSHHL